MEFPVSCHNLLLNTGVPIEEPVSPEEANEV
jgi:hypothetical protein